MERRTNSGLHSLRARKQDRSRQAAVFAATELLETRRLFSAALIWNPAGAGGAWDHSTPNWYDATDSTHMPVVFHDGDSVSFGTTGAGPIAIEATGVAPSQITVNSTAAYSLDGGGIHATTGAVLTKFGSGSLTFTGNSANTGFRTTLNGGTVVLNMTGVNALPFTGTSSGADINILGGTLLWAQPNQVQDTASINLGDNTGNTGTLNLAGNNETITTLATSGDTATAISTGAATLNLTNLALGAGTLTVAAGGAINVSNVATVQTANITIGGSMSLGSATSTFFNGSTNVLGGAHFNTSTGLFVDSSPINAQPDAVINIGTGGLSLSNTITLQSDATTPARMNLNGNISSSGNPSKIANGGSSALPGVVNLGSTTRTLNVTGGTLEIYAQIIGSGGLTETGGFLLLAGNNTYTGLTTLNGSFIELGNANGLGSTSSPTVMGTNSNLDLNGYTVAEDVTFTSGGNLRNESAHAVIESGTNSNNQPATLTGTLSITGNVGLVGNQQLNISNSISGTGGVTVNIFPSVFFNGTAANTYSGKTIIQSGTLNLSKPANTNAIAATTNPAGDVVIQGGVLKWNAANQVADGAGLELSGGKLDLNNQTETARTVLMEISNASQLQTGTGTLTLTGAANLYRGTVNIATGATVTADSVTIGDGQSGSTMAATINGTLNVGASGGQSFSDFAGTATSITVGPAGRFNTDGGQFTLRGTANTVQAGGQMNIGTGGLRFDNASNMLTLVSGAGTSGQLNLSGDLTSTASFGSTIANSGSGTTPGVVNLIGSRQISTSSDQIFISAQLNETAGNTLTVTTSGSSKVEFDRAQTLAGGLSVMGTVDHVGNNLTINQTLSGTGSVLGAGTTIVAGGTGVASPGSANGTNVGTLSTTNIRLQSGSTYSAQLQSTGDLLDVTGTVSLNGSSLVASGSVPNSNYTIIRNDGSDAVVGTFAGLPEGAAVTVGTKTFHISYVGGDGNDVVLNGNTAPSATVSLNTSNPQTNDTLTATATRFDAEGNAVSLTYVWKNGSTVVRTAVKNSGTATDLTDSLDLSIAGNGDRGDTITVTVTPNDGQVNGTPVSATATVVDSAPVVDSVTISPSSPTTNQTLSASVTSHDADGDSVSYTYQWFKNGNVISGQTGNTLDLSVAGNGDKGDSITVKVTPTDGTVSGAQATSNAVTVANSAPVANNDSYTTAEDNTLSQPAPGVMGNDSDADGDSLDAIVVSGPSHAASFTLNADGSFSYTPAANYNGSDSFTYKVSDGTASSGVATVSINVTPDNDAPSVTADNASVTVNEGQTATNTGTFNDPDIGDTVTLSASEGTVTWSGTNSGAWSWSKATSDDEAPHTVTITANDGHGGVSTATFTLKVNNVAPTATNDLYNTPLATAVSGNVITDNTGAGADSDPAGANDPLTVVSYTQPANGSVVITANGSFVYTPASTFSGDDTFLYTISDGDGGLATATVTVHVGSATSGTITTISDTCMGGTAVLVTGTSGDDFIHVSPGSDSSTLSISVNGVTTTVAKPSGRVIVFAGAGNDDVQVDGAVTNSVWLYGEAGDDRLNAGNVAQHGNLLIGGDGNDQLLGGNGRDVMIGGQGADKLIGNAEDDILIAGFTTKDKPTDTGSEEFWCDVMVEWSSGNSFQNRIHNLKNDGQSTQAAHNGTSYLNSSTLRDDTSVDQIDMLNGTSGNDWYIFQFGEDKIVAESTVEQQFDTTSLT